MRQPQSVLIYAVILSEEIHKFLLLHRVSRPDIGLSAFWQGIAGGVEECETLKESANREFREETKLTPLQLEAIDFSYSFPIMDEWRNKYPPDIKQITEHVFIAYLAQPRSPILSDEHDMFKWCTEDEAIERLTFENNIEGLKRSIDFLNKQHTL